MIEWADRARAKTDSDNQKQTKIYLSAVSISDFLIGK